MPPTDLLFLPISFSIAVTDLRHGPRPIPSIAILLAVLISFLSSCVTPRVEEFESSIGIATQDELIHQFGYPQRLKQSPNGTEVWDYEFLAGRSRCVGYRVYFDEDRRF